MQKWGCAICSFRNSGRISKKYPVYFEKTRNESRWVTSTVRYIWIWSGVFEQSYGCSIRSEIFGRICRENEIANQKYPTEGVYSSVGVSKYQIIKPLPFQAKFTENDNSVPVKIKKSLWKVASLEGEEAIYLVNTKIEYPCTSQIKIRIKRTRGRFSVRKFL